MNLVPITKIKITKERWLDQPIKYEDDMKVVDVIEEMCMETYTWIQSKKDLGIYDDYDTFKSNFINLMYDKYLE